MMHGQKNIKLEYSVFCEILHEFEWLAG